MKCEPHGNEDCPQCEVERNDSIAEAQMGYDIAGKGVIELRQRLDPLKSNWYEWTAFLHTRTGLQIEGTVQADSTGELIAPETFEAD